jgi:hypothetical protein
MTGEFDPRYDRRYQPGYVPGPDEPTSRSRAPQHPAADPPRRDVDAIGTEAERAVIPYEAGPLATEPSNADPSDADLPEPNPFERTLLGAGAVLVVGGVATAFWASSINYYPSALGSPWTWQQLLQSAAWALSAPMVTAGLAIGVGILFRRAITWRPSE